MAQNTPSDQNESVAELEAELAASRARLGRNIDELVYRAQPKTIMAEQKANLRQALKERYRSFLGTSQRESYAPATGGAPAGGSKVDELKARALGLKDQAAAKVGELTSNVTSDDPTTSNADSTTLPTRSEYKAEHSDGSDLGTQVRAKTDQARLMLDEVTHDADGELRTDRIAAGLAIAGAVLVGIGAAKRASA